ncbi:receptor-like protein kinase isoform X1 [Brachypodium distachyon]|uniref:non-specific serine/threonine protein kinase n=3 Tax=Brachypodium distachyon TaxID=15368 RepID=A0A0Q3FIV8_BRADI|nr:receptor-like protein kinase isoform X1 [Brachypodium distachyon]KQJ97980.1 hypothetical protein BRADI_3g34457v3 [Brachypodium distachyon]PNT67976.1 hypothetical protein BRADI_3g34457v3 [Brachypodium distachyon]|eukprot:XP_003572131.2 receptor-like protein kinase isoform X1 [Brachypodium distachyon]
MFFQELMGLILWHWLLFFFNLMSLCCSLSSDGLALLALSKRLILPDMIRSNWSSHDTTPCEWKGVQCKMNNVAHLNLSYYGVSGSIGPEIGRIKYLEQLDLSSNHISGLIPPELGNCTVLTLLDLSNNSLSGVIPASFMNLKKLSQLALYSNSLGGEIPEGLFKNQFLERVFLDNNKLNGSIPSSVGEMTGLRYFRLNGNMLSGVLPDSIGNCTKLVNLYLYDNKLNGSLPKSLSNMEGLIFLDVSNNGFTGDISFKFKNCKLEDFVLSSNQISGKIPEWLGNCSSLTTLGFYNNRFSGQIPTSIGLLRNISVLILTQNSLTGPIPLEIGNCRSLVWLQLGANQLEGTVPKQLAKLNKLERLFLFENHLTGEFPQDIWGIQSLEYVLLYRNNLSGRLPPMLAELKHLQFVKLLDNLFTGVIPPGFGMNSPLVEIDFTNNSFVGGIPPNICSGNRLEVLNLGNNFLNGTIPSNVANCSSLIRVRLQNNSLNGQVPQFGHCAHLNFTDLSHNFLSGDIPASLGRCVKMTYIDWSRNKLAGPIPTELGQLVKLESLDLSHNSLNGSALIILCSLRYMSKLRLQENKFSGGIPDCISQLNMLIELQLGGNVLGGNIPSSVGSLKKLSIALNLSSNSLMGDIPSQLGNLVDLASLDLSFNNLSGGLDSLRSLGSLYALNLSFNKFSGPVPENLLQFLNSTSSPLNGNSGLCISCHDGDSSCKGVNVLKLCSQSSKRGVLGRVKIAVICLGSVLVGALLILCIFLKYRCSKTKVEGGLAKFLSESSSKLIEVIESTENFDDKYIIGTGGHGTVYKATLRSGEVYAVKKLVSGATKILNASMIREMNTLGHIRHRNLVKLKDFLLKREYGLILYEFMEKGSLHDVLHGTEQAPVLEWSIRYNIALGTAHGLAYLHNDCQPAIIHRDIKPKNILLDKDMVPHISDFGIAKIIDQSPAAPQTTGIVGTIGYMAPEMAFSTRSTIEFDVYSYGVVLLELITRKMALDPSFPDNLDLVSWVSSTLNEGNIVETVSDPALMREVCGTAELEEVRGVLSIALKCIAKDPRQRPSMVDVVKELTHSRRDDLSLSKQEISGSSSSLRNQAPSCFVPAVPVNRDNSVTNSS